MSRRAFTHVRGRENSPENSRAPGPGKGADQRLDQPLSAGKGKWPQGYRPNQRDSQNGGRCAVRKNTRKRSPDCQWRTNCYGIF